MKIEKKLYNNNSSPWVVIGNNISTKTHTVNKSLLKPYHRYSIRTTIIRDGVKINGSEFILDNYQVPYIKSITMTVRYHCHWTVSGYYTGICDFGIGTFLGNYYNKNFYNVNNNADANGNYFTKNHKVYSKNLDFNFDPIDNQNLRTVDHTIDINSDNYVFTHIYSRHVNRGSITGWDLNGGNSNNAGLAFNIKSINFSDGSVRYVYGPNNEKSPGHLDLTIGGGVAGNRGSRTVEKGGSLVWATYYARQLPASENYRWRPDRLNTGSDTLPSNRIIKENGVSHYFCMYNNHVNLFNFWGCKSNNQQRIFNVFEDY